MDALGWIDSALARDTASATVTAFARLRRIEVWLDLGQAARVAPELDAITALPELPFYVLAHALWLRARLLHLQPGSPDAVLAVLAQALALLPAGARPDLRHRIELDQAWLAPPLQALALTERVIEEAHTIGHEGTVMAAWARRTGCLWRHDSALALAAAERALELGQRVDSTSMYRPELWLSAARAMQAAGRPDAARRQLVLGRDWIMACVRSGQVAEAFVDSFLHRNPVNRELLALAASSALA
jgi:hypothetical protein